MKTSKLHNLAWVFFALALTTTTVFAQGNGNRNRSFQHQNVTCLNSISGITEEQEKQIQEMEDKHHDGMAELREKRRSTNNAIEKSETRTDMLKKVEAHRNSVKAVLTADQQKQYEQLHASGNNGRNQQFTNGRGNRNFQGSGNVNQQFARGNTCNSNVNFQRKGANFQNGNGSGNSKRNYYGNQGNNFRRQNANYARGNGRFNRMYNCSGYGSQGIDTSNLKVIEEKEFKQ